MSKENGKSILQPASKIDAIKEIIFGQTMQEYDERFSNLEMLLQRKLDGQKKNSEARLKELQKEFDVYKADVEQKMEQMRKDILKKIDSLEGSKADKKTIKKYLVNLVENL